MPNLGVPELLIILLIAVLVFGVGKLPQLGGALGQSIREFREAVRAGEEDQEEEQVRPKRLSAKASQSAALADREEESAAQEQQQRQS